MTEPPADLAIIIVSTNEAHWLTTSLGSVFAAAGDATLDVVVVDNASSDGTGALVESQFPRARVVASANHGFGHANNRGALTCDSRHILFLNPDTEVVAGTFGALVNLLDRRPEVGLLGVRQVTADGQLWPTIRRFPSAGRALAEAVGAERWPVIGRHCGERRTDLALYDAELECDWTSGSFMLARREALLSGGLMDERFFIYSEEPDLCLRLRRAGWSILHSPAMTIVHHAAKGGIRPAMVAQDAFTRRQYAAKHFSRPYGGLYLGAVGLRHVLRGWAPGRDETARARRAAARLALRTLTGRCAPPFGSPPPTGLAAGAAAPSQAAAAIRAPAPAPTLS